MFKGISWGEYSIALFGLLALYYLVVISRYYRAELQAFFPGKKAATSPATAPAKSEKRNPLIKPSVVARPTVAAASKVTVEPAAAVEAAPAEVKPAPQTLPEPENSLIGAGDLAEFLDQVQAGDFDPEADAAHAPAGLENTVLLSEVFARSLSKRRAQLAELED